MKKVAILSVACFVLGCASFGPIRNTPPTPTGAVLDWKPEPVKIVNYLNENAARISTIECNDVDIDIKAGNQAIGLSGVLHCQKPKNFRLRAKTIGKELADIGSNPQEFWTWNGDEKVLYYCSYDALSRGNVALPFPVQPEWVLEVLGMATLNPNGNFTVSEFNPKQPPATFNLVERTTGPGGRPVTKVTIFNNRNTQGAVPQIVGHQIYDGQKQLCDAKVLSVHREQTAGGTVTVPNQLELRFPAQGQVPAMMMKLKLDRPRVNGSEADAAKNPGLYLKPSKEPSYNLARGLPPAAIPTGIQRTGGVRR